MPAGRFSPSFLFYWPQYPPPYLPPPAASHRFGPHMFSHLTHLQAGKALPAAVRATVAEVGPQAQAVVEAFGIPDHLVAAPIAGDW